jgi:TetR/AcrR family transcriptional repressor of lmrAB and yxaGH operons
MIRTMSDLLRRQGYAATGWRRVVSESQTPWGSQSHHFPGGKEELAVEAITSAGAAYERLLRTALDGRHPADAVAGWAFVAAQQLEASGWSDGCPIATVALEKAHQSEALATACDQALASWRAALTDSFVARGVDETTARSLAVLVLAAIEGALLQARTSRNPEPLHIVGTELAALLRNRVP